jgi:integral membrane sensor domain MASE1
MIKSAALHLSQQLIVIAAYVGTGFFGLTAVSPIPPGYATTAFLPAGIAVGAVFLYGMRFLPAIFMSSFLLNMIKVCILPGTSDFPGTCDLSTPLIAACVAPAPTLQAWIGGWWFERATKFHNYSLISVKNLLTLSISTPIICLIGATWAVSFLWLIGVVPGSWYLSNWTAWWVGDTLGVLLMLPWMLLLFPASKQIEYWTDDIIKGKLK